MLSGSGLPAWWGRFPLGVSFDRAKETKTRLGRPPLSTPLGYEAGPASVLRSALAPVGSHGWSGKSMDRAPFSVRRPLSFQGLTLVCGVPAAVRSPPGQKASLREGGDTASAGSEGDCSRNSRALTQWAERSGLSKTSDKSLFSVPTCKCTARLLPQSPPVTAPSRREPSPQPSSLWLKLKSVPLRGTPYFFTLHYYFFTALFDPCRIAAHHTSSLFTIHSSLFISHSIRPRSRRSTRKNCPVLPAGGWAESHPPRSTPSPRPRCGIPRHLRSRDGLWPHKCFAPWAKPWRRRNSLPPSIKNHGSPRNTAHRVAVSRSSRQSTRKNCPVLPAGGWAESHPPRSTPSPRPRCGIPWAYPG